ncbi:MAG TPA: hypothetical protein VGO40_02855 [Longimicrobium sp.]|jgi:hypothetical protein|nr:hypothetical protein [Longimicrobium sp.]
MHQVWPHLSSLRRALRQAGATLWSFLEGLEFCGYALILGLAAVALVLAVAGRGLARGAWRALPLGGESTGRALSA